MPEVDAEQRHGRPARELGRAQDRPVAAEHDRELERRQVGGVGVLGGQHRLDARALELAHHLAGGRPRPPRGRRGSRPGRAGSPGPLRASASTAARDPVDAGPRRRASPLAAVGATRRTRRCRSGPAAGCARRRAPPARARRRRARHRATASTHSAGQRTTPPEPSRSRPTSNCGFTISSRSASGRGDVGERRQDEGERDEREVGDDERRARGSTSAARQGADVDALADVHPRVRAQLVDHLVVTDVDRDDVRGARGAAARR